jgi:hypothetical protein
MREWPNTSDEHDHWLGIACASPVPAVRRSGFFNSVKGGFDPWNYLVFSTVKTSSGGNRSQLSLFGSYRSLSSEGRSERINRSSAEKELHTS